MATEENLDDGRGAAGHLGTWQFSLRSVFALTAFVAVLLSTRVWLGHVAYGGWLFGLAFIAWTVAGTQRSPVARLLAQLASLQLLGGFLLAPADGGAWQFAMYRLYCGIDLYLVFRLYLFCRLAQRPEPRISRLVKIRILTSPIYVALVATHLMSP